MKSNFPAWTAGGTGVRQARAYASVLIVGGMLLGVCFLAAALPAWAQEHQSANPSCDQYDCQAEGTTPEPPLPSASPPPSEPSSPPAEASAPPDSSPPPSASAPAAFAPSAPASSPPAPSPAADQYADGSALEGEVPGRPSEEESAGASADAPASASASASAATEVQDGGPANAQEPAAKPAPGATEGEEGTDESDPEAVRPIEGYSYQGEPCEDRYCGLEGVSGRTECAVYETASGETVYGCADPKTYEREGCYDITFYTREGEPYSRLDTCSGERPYAPPEPPKGDFYYWKPPAQPTYHEKGSTYVCFKRGQHRDCGIDGLPKTFDCEAFYSTRFGTVRGCFEWRKRIDVMWWKEACGPVRAYDESGRYLGTFRDCAIEKELCGEGNCGTGLDRSQGWECEKATKRWGPLYGPPEREGWILCLNFDRHDEFEANPTEETAWAACGKVVYPDGRVDKWTCGNQGGTDVFLSAWKPAEDADDALNGDDEDAQDEDAQDRDAQDEDAQDEDAQDGEDGSQGSAPDGPDVGPNLGEGELTGVGAPAGAGPAGPEPGPSSGPGGDGFKSPNPVARAAVGAREAAVSLTLSAPDVLNDAARYVRSTAEVLAEVVGTGSANDAGSGERPVLAQTAAEEGAGTPWRPMSEHEQAGSGGPDVSEPVDPIPDRVERDGANDSEPVNPKPDRGQRAQIAGGTAAGWSGVALPFAGLGTAGVLYAVRRRYRR